jgi:mono/diheme cytochrome c family protein
MKSFAVCCVSVSWLLATGASAEVLPEEAYQLHCSGCHRPDGSGVEDVVPSLRGLADLLKRPGGRAYLGRVPGVAQAPLDDAELAAVLNWVLAEFSDDDDFAPLTASELRAWRRDPLRDPLEARATLAPQAD